MNNVSRRFWLLGLSSVLFASASTVQADVVFTAEVVKVNPTCLAGHPDLLGLFCASNSDCDSAEGAGDGGCGGDIAATDTLGVEAGDILVVHYKVGDWAAEGDECRSWQVDVELTSFWSGECGSITPRGWDRDLEPAPCDPNDVDPCAGDLVCDETGICVGPDHQPELGYFVEFERPDYIFHGRPEILVVDHANYRAGSFDMGSAPFTTNDSPPRYLATLVLEVADDVCGKFYFVLNEEGSTLLSTDGSIEPTIYGVLSLIADPPPCVPSEEEQYPPNCALDARQPHSLENLVELGWDSMDWYFPEGDCVFADISRADFSVRQVPRPSFPLIIAEVTKNPDTRVVTVRLEEVFAAEAWTCITYLPANQGAGLEMCAGTLPGDVDNDRVSAPIDALRIIDNLNGLLEPPLALYQCDIDRSGRCAPADLLREIDLLNGGDRFDVWRSAANGPCPSFRP